ncbi:MAG: hypothetical protein QM733_10555 [Ilumatobacteraceae bacterium]
MTSAPSSSDWPNAKRDGDAGEHGVLDDLGEERQPAQQDMDPDDAAEHPEQHHLEHGAAHERGAAAARSAGR